MAPEIVCWSVGALAHVLGKGKVRSLRVGGLSLTRRLALERKVNPRNPPETLIRSPDTHPGGLRIQPTHKATADTVTRPPL
jgi:hypothetical protein